MYESISSLFSVVSLLQSGYWNIFESVFERIGWFSMHEILRFQITLRRNLAGIHLAAHKIRLVCLLAWALSLFTLYELKLSWELVWFGVQNGRWRVLLNFNRLLVENHTVQRDSSHLFFFRTRSAAYDWLVHSLLVGTPARLSWRLVHHNCSYLLQRLLGDIGCSSLKDGLALARWLIDRALVFLAHLLYIFRETLLLHFLFLFERFVLKQIFDEFFFSGLFVEGR